MKVYSYLIVGESFHVLMVVSLSKLDKSELSKLDIIIIRNASRDIILSRYVFIVHFIWSVMVTFVLHSYLTQQFVQHHHLSFIIRSADEAL